VEIEETLAQLDGAWRDVVMVERLLPGTIANPPEG